MTQFALNFVDLNSGARVPSLCHTIEWRNALQHCFQSATCFLVIHWLLILWMTSSFVVDFLWLFLKNHLDTKEAVNLVNIIIEILRNTAAAANDTGNHHSSIYNMLNFTRIFGIEEREHEHRISPFENFWQVDISQWIQCPRDSTQSS